MKKLNFNHIHAIQRAVRVLETGLKDPVEAKYHKDLEMNIRYLLEARDILLEMFRNPTLPFVVTQPDPVQPILDQIEKEPNGAF